MENWERIIDRISLPGDQQRVFIWGAGNTAVLAHQGMLRENLYRQLRIEAFLDSKLAGTELNGFPVYSPEIIPPPPPPQKTFSC